jgi:hypothetical protein
MNLRTIFVILLVAGFVYTAIEVRSNITELRYQHYATIERAIDMTK